MVAVALWSVLTGCDRRTVYSHYEHTPVYGWEKTHHLSYEVAPVKSGRTYREEIGVRINNGFPFRSITLIVEQQVFPSGVHRSDTLTCKFTDDNGNMQGVGVASYQFKYHLCNMTLQQGDSLHVAIRHNMRREILPGITDVGVTLQGID